MLCLLAELRTALIQSVQCGLHDLIVKAMGNSISNSP
jgi:hypothetical protein